MGFAHAGLLSAPRTYAIPNSKAVQKENASSFSQSNECGKDTFRIAHIRKEMSDFLSGYMLSDYQHPHYPIAAAHRVAGARLPLRRDRWRWCTSPASTWRASPIRGNLPLVRRYFVRK